MSVNSSVLSCYLHPLVFHHFFQSVQISLLPSLAVASHIVLFLSARMGSLPADHLEMVNRGERGVMVGLIYGIHAGRQTVGQEVEKEEGGKEGGSGGCEQQSDCSAASSLSASPHWLLNFTSPRRCSQHLCTIP